MIAVQVTTGFSPADWTVAIAAVVAAVALLWTRVVGPFIARPLGKAIRHEIDEVVAERLEPVEHAQDLASQALATIDQLVRSHNAKVDRRMAEFERRLAAMESVS